MVPTVYADGQVEIPAPTRKMMFLTVVRISAPADRQDRARLHTFALLDELCYVCELRSRLGGIVKDFRRHCSGSSSNERKTASSTSE